MSERLVAWLKEELHRQVLETLRSWPAMGRMLQRGVVLGEATCEKGHYALIPSEEMTELVLRVMFEDRDSPTWTYAALRMVLPARAVHTHAVRRAQREVGARFLRDFRLKAPAFNEEIFMLIHRNQAFWLFPIAVTLSAAMTGCVVQGEDGQDAEDLAGATTEGPEEVAEVSSAFTSNTNCTTSGGGNWTDPRSKQPHKLTDPVAPSYKGTPWTERERALDKKGHTGLSPTVGFAV